MKTQMKAIGAVTIVTVLALAAVSGVTYSWFSDSENSEITVSTGIVKVETSVYDVGTAGAYIQNLEQGKSLPKTMDISNIVGNATNHLTINFTYTVKLYNTIAAKYYLDSTSTDVSFVSINMASNNADVKVGEIIALNPGDMSSPLVANISVTISIDLNDAMGKTAKINIRNEIVQSDADIYKIQKNIDNVDEFNEVMNGSDSAEVKLSNGDYSFASTVDLTDKGDKKIVGNGSNTKVDINSLVGENNNNLLYARGCNLIFENLTLDLLDGGNYSGFVSDNITFINCTINNTLYLYGNSAVFKDCTFNQTNSSYYNIWTWGIKTLTLDSCTLNSAGRSVLVFGEDVTTSVFIYDCSFTDSNKGAMGKAVVEVGDANYGKHNTFDINISNANVKDDEFSINATGTNTGTKLWGNKNSMDEDHLKVTINGVKVYGNAS